MAVDLGTAVPLGQKLIGLGAEAEDLDILFQTIKQRVRVAVNDHVIRNADSAGQVRVLLAGTSCSYRRKEGGTRSILSFQHPGDFCDLQRYVLPDLQSEIGIQALTDCTVAIIDYRDMDRLLLRPTLASALWRASMLEAAIDRERLSRMGRGAALERVAHLLCENLARREVVGIHSPRLPFSQIDIADAAGLSVVHVNRTVQTLRSLNVLSKANQVIEVIDREQLATIAEFDGHYLSLPKLVSKWAVQIEPTRRCRKKSRVLSCPVSSANGRRPLG